jgi:dihydrofolate synthase/folylpolyglutamate synthase
LHPKEIDLSLDRINKLLTKLDNPQNQLDNVITVVGTNGKYSTIQAMRSFYVESGLKCNLYLSPHIQKINERFIYDNNEISDNNLTQLLEEVEDINNGDPITYFEILTAAFIKGCVKYKDNITLVEAGLFHNFDATNVFKNNLASVITIIHNDQTQSYLNYRTLIRIIFGKTSKLLNSNIIIAKQHIIEDNKNNYDIMIKMKAD